MKIRSGKTIVPIIGTDLWVVAREKPFVYEIGETHDEGWHSDKYKVWMESDGVIMLDIVRDGTDCDGRHTSYRTYEWNDETEMWTMVDGREYDQFAEMMNY